MRNPLAKVLLAAAILLPACAESAPSPTEYDDIARIVAGDTAASATAFADSVAIARGQLPGELRRESSGLVAGGHNGLTYHHYVLPLDESSALVIAWWGELVRTQGVWRLDGLDSPTVMVSGHTSLMHGAIDPYRFNGESDVLVFVDEPSALILGGAIEQNLAIAITGDSFDVRANVSFPSAGRATITLDDEPAYDVDLTPAPITPR